MELEEVIKHLEQCKKLGITPRKEAVETALQVLENSIPKKKIKEKIEQLKEKSNLDYSSFTIEDLINEIKIKTQLKVLQELLNEAVEKVCKEKVGNVK